MRLIDADALKADYGMKDDCADCEKEAVGSIRSCQYDAVYTKMDFCGWIDSMPTIEPEPQWIPCSERLPDEGVEVILQFKRRKESVNSFMVTYRFDYNAWRGIGRDVYAIAWMPRPEEYKEEQE